MFGQRQDCFDKLQAIFTNSIYLSENIKLHNVSSVSVPYPDVFTENKKDNSDTAKRKSLERTADIDKE